VGLEDGDEAPVFERTRGIERGEDLRRVVCVVVVEDRAAG
jgi:hypothetical protein